MSSHELICTCGHAFKSEREKDYCSKCGGAVFLDPKKQRGHRMNTYYTYAMALGVITFLTYVFIEMIAKPLMRY